LKNWMPVFHIIFLIKKWLQGKNIHVGDDFLTNYNVKIGNNVVVAAGAVVSKNVPDNCVVGGVPAKKIKDLENGYYNIPKHYL
jgi:serine acetyltransferase